MKKINFKTLPPILWTFLYTLVWFGNQQRNGLHFAMGFSRSSQFLTQHPHEDFIDPGEDADDVEGGEGNVEEEADADLDAFVLATLPAAEEGKSGNGG